MSEVGQSERTTQNRVVQLFQQQLDYTYLGNWHKRDHNSNVESDLLTTFLRDTQKYNHTIITKALHELNKLNQDTTKNLYDINKEIYRLLRYGININPEAGEKTQSVYLINWQEPLKNNFYIAEEVSIKGENDKRPDIVLYINGIALAVLELKSSTVSVSEGIRQNLDSQESIFIKSFFNTVQLVAAGNDTQGLRYGTTKTSEKYYLTWKEDSYNHITNLLDKHLLQLCEKHRFLDIIYNFILFDSGIKKLCRSHQYLGIKAAQDHIKHQQGGIIWHTQGSGKSLTMVWLTKWIREFDPKARVLIITDREELDNQIEGVFLGVNENIYRTKSGQDLITQLQNTTPSLICSLIHKFGKKREKPREEPLPNPLLKGEGTGKTFVSGSGKEGNILPPSPPRRGVGGEVILKEGNILPPSPPRRGVGGEVILKEGNILPPSPPRRGVGGEVIGDEYEDYIKELKRNLPKKFQPYGQFYVFVDECHRTQAGKLHKAMKDILPNALFIGFTGTPLLKQDQQSSLEVFGKYIHTYKFNEAVEDKVVLDLRYEARNVEQYITSQRKIDQWFADKTSGLTETAKAELKKRWGTMQKILSSKSRLEMIVKDIISDFSTKERLQNGKGNAILVAGSIYEACKYYELFQSAGFSQCAIITSYDPTIKSIKGETTGEGKTDKIHQYEIYQKMLNGQKADKFEQDVKNNFVNSPAQMQLLIVVDKLLTGFDAPPATYLYIDKKMQDHGLFQAVCRVNRLDSEDKEYGYIIDYKDLFASLEKSVQDYTCAAFADYDIADIAGLLSNRLEKGKNDLDTARQALKALCEAVKPPYHTADYTRYFCGNTEKPEDLKNTEPQRLLLYKSVNSLVRNYANIANEMAAAGYTEREIYEIKKEVKHYQQVSQEIKLASGDYIDFKAYQNDMRQLIDSYIGAEASQILANFENLTLVELIVNHGVNAVDSLPPGIRNNQTAVAETIENNLRKLIVEQQPTNPKYFDKMSILLQELIDNRKTATEEYENYLQKIIILAQEIHQPSKSSTYPPSLNTSAKIALYDNLDQDEQLALTIDRVIRQTKQDGWRGNKVKERMIKNAIKKYLPLPEQIDEMMEIIKNQNEY